MADRREEAKTQPVVLVVDDDASMRMLAVAAVTAVGLRGVEVGDGLDAVGALESQRPDLIVLDIMMPGIDGFEACRRVRAHPLGERVPILIVTGREDVRSITSAYEAGATDFITKPINWMIFGQRVRYLVRAGRALAELAEARVAAEAAGHAKSEFLANMSHEIRTPLTAILGYIDLLIDGGPAPEESGDYLKVVRRNGQHLLAILNDVLDTSKLEAGKLGLERMPCSPRAVIADVVSLLGSNAVDKAIALEVEPRGALPETIHTDPTRLRQILLNLVGNAIKFTERGWVRIALELAPASRGREPMLAFTVADTGIGLSAEAQSRIFEAFAQADTSMRRRFGGSGLGLTISSRLAELLGGAIEVESELGRGSAFRLTVPTGPLDGVTLVERRWEPDSEAGDTPVPAALRDLEGRVLLAEDGADNRRLITTVLRKAGLAVDVAQNGASAIALALEAQDAGVAHDLVLMDVQMPGVDGLTAARRLREAGYDRPIVALTAHARGNERARCLDAGCDDFATKPIHREQLLRLVARHVGKDLEGRVDSG